MLTHLKTLLLIFCNSEDHNFDLDYDNCNDHNLDDDDQDDIQDCSDNNRRSCKVMWKTCDGNVQ